jgi:lipopolysaccharide/colanic/teichoic acid biosynthesis glycosyltransferase
MYRTSTGAIAAAVAMPLADVVALGAALGWVTLSTWFPAAAAAYAVLVFVSLSISGLHRLRICLRVADQAGRIAIAAAVPVVAVLPWVTAGQALRLAVLTIGLLVAARVAVSAALRAAHRRGRLTEGALLTGDGPAACELASLLEAHPELGLIPVDVLDSRIGLGAPAAGHSISRVIVCAPADSGVELGSVLRGARVLADQALAADVCLASPLPGLGAALPGGRLDDVWGVPLLPLRRSPWAAQAPPGRAVKRAFDVLAAAVLLVVTAPLVAVAAVAVRLTLRRPALFRQVRVVGLGNLAEIVKLRTLGRHGDPDTSWSVPAGQCGALGRVLRVTHIDELPQLVSVLRGDMSLVGPRPERPHFVREFSQAVPGYAGRQRMPAGLTGWAQVHGLNGDTSIRDRARFDNYYIEHWTFWLDLVVLGRTMTSIAAEVITRAHRLTRNHGGK